MITAARLFDYPKAPALSLQIQRLFLKLSLIFSDAVALGLAFHIAFWIRFDFQLTVAPEVEPSPEFYSGLIMILIPLWILIFLVFNHYNLRMKIGGISEYSRTFNACTICTMLLVIIAFFESRFIVSRAWMVYSWLFTFFLVALNRFVVRRIVYALRTYGYFLTPAVIVGTNQEAATLAADLSEWRYSGLRILGFVTPKSSDPAFNGVNWPVLGPIEKIKSIIESWNVEDIIVATTDIERDALLQLGEDVNDIPNVNLRLSSGLYELLTTGVTVKTIGTVPLLSVNKLRLEQEEIYLKTLMDYALTLIALLFIWPVFLVIALLIKLDSSGPVFYRRAVLGVSGKPFNALKFRTMFPNGESLLKDRPELIEQLGRDHKLKDDPRITRVGFWLRKYSLDELPQLFNVLLGQMSLVGPRMITMEEAAKYGQRKFNLLTVKPGITGLWQVSGRSDISYDERVRLDMYYIRNYSLWMDLQIFFIQTPPAVLKGEGAY